MDDDKEALDNTGNVLQNALAQSATLGAFNLAMSPITEFTQINPNTMKMDNNALEEAEAIRRRDEDDSEEK